MAVYFDSIQVAGGSINGQSGCSMSSTISSISDKIDLLYEAYGELEKFNPEPVFVNIFQSSLEALAEFKDMASVKYLAKEILPEVFKEDFIHKDLLFDLAKSLLPDFAAAQQ